MSLILPKKSLSVVTSTKNDLWIINVLLTLVKEADRCTWLIHSLPYVSSSILTVCRFGTFGSQVNSDKHRNVFVAPLFCNPVQCGLHHNGIAQPSCLFCSNSVASCEVVTGGKRSVWSGKLERRNAPLLKTRQLSACWGMPARLCVVTHNNVLESAKNRTAALFEGLLAPEKYLKICVYHRMVDLKLNFESLFPRTKTHTLVWVDTGF